MPCFLKGILSTRFECELNKSRCAPLHKIYFFARKISCTYKKWNVFLLTDFFIIFQIEVEPRNHQAPKFSSLIYEVGCPENSADGHLIATLTAEDPDRSIFGKIRYSIADTDEPDLFTIDENAGEVRLSSTPDVSLDREMRASHIVEVVAEDGGGWLGYTKLVVKVIDVNECN